ncbi:MAG: hypothetical protein DRN21_02585 [Thermoplasmata archaeon]|nr:MAG: hypothetical protein DRN21_02585 [Thermoplasmata archaeon]
MILEPVCKGNEYQDDRERAYAHAEGLKMPWDDDIALLHPYTRGEGNVFHTHQVVVVCILDAALNRIHMECLVEREKEYYPCENGGRSKGQSTEKEYKRHGEGHEKVRAGDVLSVHIVDDAQDSCK